jgi:acetolactate synthase-1/2/3 large subunit
MKGEKLMANGAEIVAKYLEAEGVEYVFGMCGHTNVALLDALTYKTKVKFISFRHEQIAAHAADAYFRATHKPGVVLVHVGPGMTNAVTGVANASLDSSAMLVIAGDIPSFHFGQDPHQEIKLHMDGDQFEVYRPFVKRAWRVHDVKFIPDIMTRAFNIAISGRPGAVLVDVPMDMFSRECGRECEKLTFRKVTGKRIAGDASEIEKAMRMLKSATNPVLYFGGGVILSDACQEATELAEYFAVPVATTLMGKGTIPEDHPLSVGMTGFWGTALANNMTKQADLILAIGVRFPETDSSSWIPGYTFNIPPTKLIHVNIDPEEIGKIYPVEAGIIGDAKTVMRSMLEFAKASFPMKEWKNSPIVSKISKEKGAWLKDLAVHQNSDAIPMRPERILKTVRDVLPRDGIILTDVGWNKNGVGQQFPIYLPRTHMPPGGLATMGFGPAAAVGAKVGAPDKVVIALVGDGAFSSISPAVATAVENDLGVIWLVMNNFGYGVITGLQKRAFGRAAATEFKKVKSGEKYNPDFSLLAKAYGAEGYRVENPKELKPTLEKAIASGRPTVLDVVMDPTVFVPTTGHWDVTDIYKGEM